MINAQSKNKKGFTLIEMMVAVSIFIIVAFVVTSTFLVALDAYRKAKQISAIVDNINFAMDTMLIDIREGKNYPTDIGDLSSFSFKDLLGNSITYQLNGNILQKCSPAPSACVDLTSNEAPIAKLNFKVYRPGSALGRPPMVKINVYGKVVLRWMTTDISVQTTVTQRNPD